MVLCVCLFWEDLFPQANLRAMCDAVRKKVGEKYSPYAHHKKGSSSAMNGRVLGHRDDLKPDAVFILSKVWRAKGIWKSIVAL